MSHHVQDKLYKLGEKKELFEYEKYRNIRKVFLNKDAKIVSLLNKWIYSSTNDR